MAEAPEPSRRAQRHRELWESRNTRLAQLLFATLLFGGLATWKVARPAAAQAEEHRASSVRLDAANARLQQLEAEQRELDGVGAALANADAAIERAPWKKALAELKEGFVRLREASDCYERDRKAARDFFASRGVGGESAGGSSRRIADQQVPTSQVPPRPDALLPSPEDAERARRAALFAPITIDREAAAAADERAFDGLWNAAMIDAARDHATEIVETIEQQSREQVEAPVEAVLRESPQLRARAPTLLATTQQLEVELGKWSVRRRDDSSWYATIAGKDDAFGELSHLVADWSDHIRGELGPARDHSLADHAQAQEQVRATKEEQKALRERQLELEASLQNLLPEWIRGFVTSAELVHYLPFALTLLAAAIAVLTWLVRHHHRECRGELFADPAAWRDPAVTSCWTLVDRGTLGTLSACVCFAAATAGWWLATNAALQCASATWQDAFFGTPPFDESWLRLPRGALAVVPALVLLGLAAAWRDRRAQTR